MVDRPLPPSLIDPGRFRDLTELGAEHGLHGATDLGPPGWPAPGPATLEPEECGIAPAIGWVLAAASIVAAGILGALAGWVLDRVRR